MDFKFFLCMFGISIYEIIPIVMHFPALKISAEKAIQRNALRS